MAYSDSEITEALIKLAINKYDYDKTEKDTGISARTLKRWDKNAAKKAVPELLERAIERMLMSIPTNWKGNDWAIALGILMDKWLLMEGKATSRSENIIGWLEDIPDKELDELVKQFEQAANSSSTSKD